ncbi:MAG: 3'-5' exonuclease, partial [Candidatus Altarchaeaceae archaeon]
KSLFVVGDKKQAIYRWRGGVTNLFEYVYKISENIKEKNLSTNYRSGEYIVKFINKVFSKENIERHINFIKNDYKFQNLNVEDVLKIYDDANEEYYKENENKGYVYVCKIKNEGDLENVKEKFLEIIKNLRERYEDKDIAILVRENKEIDEFMKFLHEYDKNIAIDAPFTANIKNNQYIKEIVHFLKFLENNDSYSFIKFITGEIFHKATKIPKEEIFELIMNLKDREKLYEKFKEKFEIDKKDNLYDLLVSFFEKFKVFENFKENSLYFLHLLEFIKEKEIKTLKKFFEFYENDIYEDEFYINTSNSNAIHIMTIHKAKGLEFKAVVIPYAKIEIRPENIFIEENGSLNLYYIKKDYLNFSEKLKEIYCNEYNKRYIDELNNIYVAMTRAKECLYMLIPEKIG